MSENQCVWVNGKSDDQLEASIQECWDALNDVLDAVGRRPDIQAGIRRMSNADNMVAELNAIAARSPKLADLILHASLAALVNTQGIKTLDRVLFRRASVAN